MDDRQRKVTVGAGLQESRLNTELISFLNKYWHYPVFLAALIAAVYMGLGWLKAQRERRLDAAFASYETALLTGSPDELLKVAADHKSQAGVWELATLSATDILLESARMGIKPTTTVAQAANPLPEHLITDDDVKASLERARDLTRQVEDATDGSESTTVYAQRARWNYATAEAGLGNYDAAVASMQEFKSVADAQGMTDQAAAAQARLDLLARSRDTHALVASADLPESNRKPATSPSNFNIPGAGNSNFTDEQLSEMIRQLEATGQVPAGAIPMPGTTSPESVTPIDPALLSPFGPTPPPAQDPATDDADEPAAEQPAADPVDDQPSEDPAQDDPAEPAPEE